MAKKTKAQSAAARITKKRASIKQARKTIVRHKQPDTDAAARDDDDDDWDRFDASLGLTPREKTCLAGLIAEQFGGPHEGRDCVFKYNDLMQTIVYTADFIRATIDDPTLFDLLMDVYDALSVDAAIGLNCVFQNEVEELIAAALRERGIVVEAEQGDSD